MTEELKRKEIPFVFYGGFPLVETHKSFENRQKFLKETWETPCRQVIYRIGVVFFPSASNVKG